MDIDNDHPRNSDFDPLGSSDSGETHPGNIEEFPGASQSYPHGNTFMDQFFSDEYRVAKREFILSVCLTTRLAACVMAAIDRFLSLQLVSALTDIITCN
ncbi:hypothetical protein JVU11DRAFT_1091 [Chiua virens]|nr:hypothetical protein JVU11DRAFT_1091 [Chiua virens]